MKDPADGCYNIFKLRYWFGQLDLRPLGLARLAFGTVLVLAVLDTGPILADLLSDGGVMPRAALLSPGCCCRRLAGPSGPSHAGHTRSRDRRAVPSSARMGRP